GITPASLKTWPTSTSRTPRPSFWSRTISASTARLHSTKPFRPSKPGAWSSASNGTTLQNTAAGSIWPSLKRPAVVLALSGARDRGQHSGFHDALAVPREAGQGRADREAVRLLRPASCGQGLHGAWRADHRRQYRA